MLASRDGDPVLVLPSLKLTEAIGDCVDKNVFSVLNVTEPLEERLGTLEKVMVPHDDEDTVGEIVAVCGCV